MSQLARRYAKALLELATEQNQVDKIGRDLKDLGETWKGSEELGRVFESPEVSAEQRREIVDAVATRMGLAPIVKQTLYLLSDLGQAIAGEVMHVDAGFHVVGVPDLPEG